MPSQNQLQVEYMLQVLHKVILCPDFGVQEATLILLDA